MANEVEKTIQTAKDNLPNVTPPIPGLHAQVSAQELKSRLQWGEPGLTIIDVRDRGSFNECHIMGAMPMPMDTLVDRSQNQLERDRDIYIYGSDDNQAAQAANALRQAGFRRVAEIKGGLNAWTEIAAPMEGPATKHDKVDDSEFNIVSRLQAFSEIREKEKQQKAAIKAQRR